MIVSRSGNWARTSLIVPWVEMKRPRRWNPVVVTSVRTPHCDSRETTASLPKPLNSGTTMAPM